MIRCVFTAVFRAIGFIQYVVAHIAAFFYLKSMERFNVPQWIEFLAIVAISPLSKKKR